MCYNYVHLPTHQCGWWYPFGHSTLAAFLPFILTNLFPSPLSYVPSLFLFIVGVTHLKVASDVDGIFAILDWLSFVPKTRSAPIPILPSGDPVDRRVDYMPPKAPYDPRWMISGRLKPGKYAICKLL